MEGSWLTKDEIADALGVSSRTVQRRISALEASDPELVRREAGGAVLVAERAFVDGLVGTPTTEQLFDDVSVAPSHRRRIRSRQRTPPLRTTHTRSRSSRPRHPTRN